METKDYLEYIVDKIHRTIIATTDDEGLPVTCAIDMMDFDEESLYFLTAKGKGFYDRLVKRGFLAFTAMKGEDTLSSVAVSVRGKAPYGYKERSGNDYPGIGSDYGMFSYVHFFVSFISGTAATGLI